MRKTLTRHGNSYALIIDKAILELLHIAPETLLDLSTDGRSLTITPAGDDEIKNSLGRINERHGEDLRRLAE